MKSAFPAMYY